MLEYEVVKLSKKNIQMLPKQNSMLMNIQGKLDSLIDQIKTDINQIPPKGMFARITKELNLNGGSKTPKKILMSLERDESIDGEILMLLSVIRNQNEMARTVMLANGSCEKVLKCINDENFKNQLLERITKLCN